MHPCGTLRPQQEGESDRDAQHPGTNNKTMFKARSNAYKTLSDKGKLALLDVFESKTPAAAKEATSSWKVHGLCDEMLTLKSGDIFVASSRVKPL